MRKYTVNETELGTTILLEENGVTYAIPVDPANSDYQTYLADEAASK